ncbi:restriction endonuclease subunit S [Paenibacillus illinoisensis]|uniref:restriction endonuclease subunit S n=1 Tax=Paenibacillus illinoisensis TaxID=59845 RepID=UPI0013E32991|nr:restriction endonuclease subunit S [Paenibacillus illinoisensis]
MNKKKTKSQEELLKEALVPVEEQPYEVPENWVWVKVGSINNGKRRGIEPNQFEDEVFELYSVPSFVTNEPELLSGQEISSNKQVVEPGDVLICKINPRINRVWTVSKKSRYRQIASTEWIVISENQNLHSKYLMYLFRSPYFRRLLTANVSGVGGSLTRARPKDVEKYPVALPPLNEQKRIADKVERLLGKINLAKQLIEEAKATFELRRAAILDKAFRGELTKKWRDENGVDSIWENHEIRSLIQELNQGWSPKCENYPSIEAGKWGVIKTTAIQHMNFVEEENKQLPDSLQPREKHEIKAGDILITRAGPRIRVGVCCLVREVRPRLLLCDKAYRVRVNLERVIPEYLVLVLNSPKILDEINSMKTGISDSGVNLTQEKFLSIMLNIPSINEQKEIVRIVDKLFVNEQKVNEIYGLVNKTDIVQASILDQAFKGELGTNNAVERNYFSQ